MSGGAGGSRSGGIGLSSLVAAVLSLVSGAFEVEQVSYTVSLQFRTLSAKGFQDI